MTDDYIYTLDDLQKRFDAELSGTVSVDEFIRTNVPPMVATVHCIQALSEGLKRPKPKQKYTQKQIDRMYWKDRR